MREVKFRYWCKVEKEMYDKAYVEEHMKLAFMSELIEAAQERYIFLQYTGMKDVNGVEIYEGDIVSYKMRNLSQAFGDADAPAYMEYKRLIEFFNYGFTVPQGFVKGITVIGNVFENPELIK